MRPDWQDLAAPTLRALGATALTPLSTVDASVFGVVVIGVVALALLVAVLGGLTRGSAYDRIGRGGLSSDGRSAGPDPTPAGRSGEREEEIRQMQDARRAIRARRTSAPTAAPATSAPEHPPRATGPPAPAEARRPVPGDAGLADELRDLAVARNLRRRRQGLDPLDVDAEVARRLRDL